MRWLLDCSDGTNLYHITYFDPKVTLRQLGSKRPDEVNKARQFLNSASARIAHGSVPYGIPDSTIYVLWYAFASEWYFAHKSDNYLHPLHPLPEAADYARDFRVFGFWELNKASPQLPQRIWFTMHKKYTEDSGVSPPLSGFYTNSFFLTESVTNLNSLTLPSQIAVQTLIRPYRTNASFFVLGSKISVRITNAVLMPHDVEFTPRITEATLVSDLRPVTPQVPFAAALQVRSNWPSLARSTVQALAQKQQRELPVTLDPRITLTRILVGAAILLPSLLLFLRCRKAGPTKI